MTGTTRAFFTQKRNENEQVVQQAQTAATKVAAADQALEIMGKNAYSEADLDQLFELHSQLS
jgi:hypothetical protein